MFTLVLLGLLSITAGVHTPSNAGRVVSPLSHGEFERKHLNSFPLSLVAAELKV